MDVVTHTKHAFIQGTPHSHTLLSRIRECWPALRTAAIRGRSGATRASAPCRLLFCSKLALLLNWVKLPSPSTGRHGCKPNMRLYCPSAACRMHAARQPRRARSRSRCRPQTRAWMGLSATAAAAALARPRSSSSRFVPTTFVTCSIEERHRARHGTRRQICSRSGEACGSMREGCAPSARRDSSKCKRRQAWTPSSNSKVTLSPCRERRQLLCAAQHYSSYSVCRLVPASSSKQRPGGGRCLEHLSGSRRPPHEEE